MWWGSKQGKNSSLGVAVVMSCTHRKILFLKTCLHLYWQSFLPSQQPKSQKIRSFIIEHNALVRVQHCRMLENQGARNAWSHDYPITTARANKLDRNFLVMNRQPLELESCSNPLRIQQVLESKSKKKCFRFRFGFSGGTATSGGVYAFFSHLWPALGPYPLGNSFASRFF